MNRKTIATNLETAAAGDSRKKEQAQFLLAFFKRKLQHKLGISFELVAKKKGEK